MSTPTFNDVPHLWNGDGSLRDVYFTDTDIEQWRIFLTAVQSFQSQYSYDDEVQNIGPVETIFSNREGHHSLSIFVCGVTINCHFFVVDEIELDIDPREVIGQIEHEAILKFIESMAQVIERPARLTPENSLETPFLCFDHSRSGWTIHR